MKEISVFLLICIASLLILAEEPATNGTQSKPQSEEKVTNKRLAALIAEQSDIIQQMNSQLKSVVQALSSCNCGNLHRASYY